MKGLLIGAIVDKVTTLKDKSMKITFATQEMSPATGGTLLSYQNMLATLYISPAEVTTREIEQVDKIDPQMPGKSPSARMRNVLYILYKQDQEGFEMFDVYYQAKMHKFIEELKNNIKDEPFGN